MHANACPGIQLRQSERRGMCGIAHCDDVMRRIPICIRGSPRPLAPLATAQPVELYGGAQMRKTEASSLARRPKRVRLRANIYPGDAVNLVPTSLPESSRADFGRVPVVGTHALMDDPLFSDAGLIALLDSFPRERLYAFNMGVDPTRIDEFSKVRHVGVSGKQLLEAVRRGRLWLNITRVELADPAYRRLIDTLYEQLAGLLPDFSPLQSQGTLLISSPQAQVYYHADGPSSVLWHLRGRKRVWVYPALDERYLSRAMLEDIFAGVRHEFVPFDPTFDEGAEVFDLEPGQWIHWPQNAPHRVVNGDSFNVSLSTEHFTKASLRRYQLFMANRFFRTRFGRRQPSLCEDGLVARSKALVQRSARRLGLHPLHYQQHAESLCIKLDAPGAVAPLGAHSGMNDASNA